MRFSRLQAHQNEHTLSRQFLRADTSPNLQLLEKQSNAVRQSLSARLHFLSSIEPISTFPPFPIPLDVSSSVFSSSDASNAQNCRQFLMSHVQKSRDVVQVVLSSVSSRVDTDGIADNVKHRTLHIAYCILHITHHTLHLTHYVTHHTSHITPHKSHITHHTSHIAHHTSHITHHTSHITHHTSHITHHTSHITDHTSHITHHTSHMSRGAPTLTTSRRRSCCLFLVVVVSFQLSMGSHGLLKYR